MPANHSQGSGQRDPQTQFSVHKTSQNQNNEIGVPLTLLNTPPTAQFLVCEMGMRGRGKSELTQIARPNYVIIVSLGSTHLELSKLVETSHWPKQRFIAFLNSPKQPLYYLLNEQMPYFELVRSIAIKMVFK